MKNRCIIIDLTLRLLICVQEYQHAASLIRFTREDDVFTSIKWCSSQPLFALGSVVNFLFFLYVSLCVAFTYLSKLVILYDTTLMCYQNKVKASKLRNKDLH